MPRTKSKGHDAEKHVFRVDSSYTLSSDEDDMVSALTSNEHEQLSTSNRAVPQRVIDTLAKLAKIRPQDEPHEPPYPQQIPSSFEIDQTIADQEVQVAELDAKLGELAREILLVLRQRDAVAEEARNYRSFIAGKCSS
jgi:hypothetical protein